MKTICIVRHGKSSWEDLSLEDYQRPLLKKGINRTKKIGNYLVEKEFKPDIIVSSHAKRALETAKILANKIGYNQDDIQINKTLYFSGIKAIEDVICSVPNDLHCALLVGHNPDMTRFANLFLPEKVDYLPTSAVVSIRFHTSNWRDILLSDYEILFVAFPKTL